MSGEQFASVWDAIEDTPGAAEVMRVRAGLMVALRAHVARGGLTRDAAVRRLGVTRPRLEELVRGKVDLFSVEALVGMAVRAGLGVGVWVSKADLISD